MNFASRLQFLLTGTFHQFRPGTLRDIPRGVQADRFHIAPTDDHRLRYLADHLGCRVESVLGDTRKRAWLLPLHGARWSLGYPWARALFFNSKANAWRARNEEIFRHINSPAALFSRSIVFVLRKREPVASPGTRTERDGSQVRARGPGSERRA